MNRYYGTSFGSMHIRLHLTTAIGRAVVPVHSHPKVLARMVTLLIADLIRVKKTKNLMKNVMKGKLNGKS